MKRALFSVLLFLVPGVALAQQVVQANQIEVGLGMRFLQAASIALNPWQENTRWPLYAYSAGDVRRRGCDSFNDVPAGRELAFVSPVSDTQMAGRYIGVRVREAGEIQRRCNQTGHTFAQDLNELLSITEARAEILESGEFKRTNPMQFGGNGQLECTRPFMTGTLRLETLGAVGGSVNAATADRNLSPAWRNRSEGPDVPSMTLSWTAIPRSPNDAHQEEAGSESPEATETFWRFIPEESNPVVGTFFLSSDAPGRRTSRNVTTLWRDGHIRWTDTPLPNDDQSIQFTLWYMPLFCGSEVAEDWYLVSDRPLQRVSSDFRVNMSALDSP